MLQKAYKGELSSFRSKIGDIPKEALPYLTGLKQEDPDIKIEAMNNQIYEVEFQDLNALELACIGGHSKLLTYIVDDLGLHSVKDF